VNLTVAAGLAFSFLRDQRRFQHGDCRQHFHLWRCPLTRVGGSVSAQAMLIAVVREEERRRQSAAASNSSHTT
jgi:hypothetical protein